MAFLAGHTGMCAGEREVRFVVIERHVIPTGGPVTCRTVRAKLAVVGVVLFVTGVAIRRRAFEDIVEVTLRARHIGVSAS